MGSYRAAKTTRSLGWRGPKTYEIGATDTATVPTGIPKAHLYAAKTFTQISHKVSFPFT